MKSALWICLCLLLAAGARCHNYRDVFIEGRLYFVDADCYSRMSRAALVSADRNLFVRHHDFENHPEGTVPHTTAPMDWLIAALKALLDLGFRLGASTSVLRSQTLDLAGALVSPLLGMATCAWLAIWARLANGGRAFRGMAPLLFAISPIAVHGTLLGRPDHQSLLLLCLAVALGAELLLAREMSRRWSLVSGGAWGLALWVSLYEPAILLAAVLLLWAVGKPRALWQRERRLTWLTLAAIATLFLLTEGWRLSWPASPMRAAFANWQPSIGELAPLDLRSPLLYRWLGALILATPVLLFLTARKQRLAWPILILIAGLAGLTCWQLRWGYFLALAFAMSLPWQLAALPKPWIGYLLFAACLWPLARDWDDRLFPDLTAKKQLALARRDVVLLRDIATPMRSPEQRPFLAPWWLSPPLAYWSGQPGIAGSSHQSLPGIMETARFYLSVSTADAAVIVRRLGVKLVVADEPSRAIHTSALLLGVPAPDAAFATRLAETRHEGARTLGGSSTTLSPTMNAVSPTSEFLRLRETNDFYQLYEVIAP